MSYELLFQVLFEAQEISLSNRLLNYLGMFLGGNYASIVIPIYRGFEGGGAKSTN